MRFYNLIVEYWKKYKKLDKYIWNFVMVCKIWEYILWKGLDDKVFNFERIGKIVGFMYFLDMVVVFSFIFL